MSGRCYIGGVAKGGAAEGREESKWIERVECLGRGLRARTCQDEKSREIEQERETMDEKEGTLFSIMVRCVYSMRSLLYFQIPPFSSTNALCFFCYLSEYLWSITRAPSAVNLFRLPSVHLDPVGLSQRPSSVIRIPMDLYLKNGISFLFLSLSVTFAGGRLAPILAYLIQQKVEAAIHKPDLEYEMEPRQTSAFEVWGIWSTTVWHKKSKNGVGWHPDDSRCARPDHAMATDNLYDLSPLSIQCPASRGSRASETPGS